MSVNLYKRVYTGYIFIYGFQGRTPHCQTMQASSTFCAWLSFQVGSCHPKPANIQGPFLTRNSQGRMNTCTLSCWSSTWTISRNWSLWRNLRCRGLWMLKASKHSLKFFSWKVWLSYSKIWSPFGSLLDQMGHEKCNLPTLYGFIFQVYLIHKTQIKYRG